MNEDRIHMTFDEPIPIRVLLEEELSVLQILSDLLTSCARARPVDPANFDDITKVAFLSIFNTIKDTIDERTIDYSGEKYLIMAKGRRKLTLGFKREPDIYIGSEYGLNFIEACQSYFSIYRLFKYGYNLLKNTFYGRMLYALPVKNNINYDLGFCKTPANGYSAWFNISNFTFRLAEVRTRGEALIECKMLRKAIEDLVTQEITKQ